MVMSTIFDEKNLIYPMEILRKARSGLTQEEFAKTVGLAWSTYQRWMSNETPPKLTSSQVLAICEICRVDANHLMLFLEGRLDVEEIPD